MQIASSVRDQSCTVPIVHTRIRVSYDGERHGRFRKVAEVRRQNVSRLTVITS